MDIPRLVAHRGYAKRYPENTLLAIEGALKAGACFVEFDVQMSGDGVPVLFHDATITRASGKRGRIYDLSLEQISALCVNEPKRFGTRHRNATVPTLASIVDYLKSWPRVTTFVEIKEESLEKHGREKVVKTIVNILKPIEQQAVVISYDTLALRTARAMGTKRIGWVLPAWKQETRATATELVPNFLFCNQTKLPKNSDPLWQGPWSWVIYEITKPSDALRLAARGVEFIETMAVGDMFKNTKLRSRACLND